VGANRQKKNNMLRWLLFKQKDFAGKVSNFLWRYGDVDGENKWVGHYLKF